ncbi:hypothetical protein SKUN_00670 [Spiroplasma kunkelii CR2-3x]|uniref:Spiroplasmavirus-related protein n=2 Tax=Spiroplasma kunkelii TaxID=47834 RepID=A0A0K2JGK2_SPIKU|nr:hypothetical protein SKUN_00670 [Spiroplasma kunkelii CR2-3x]
MFDNNNLKNPILYSESNLVVLDEMALYIYANKIKDGAMKKYSGVITSLFLCDNMILMLYLLCKEKKIIEYIIVKNWIIIIFSFIFWILYTKYINKNYKNN